MGKRGGTPEQRRAMGERLKSAREDAGMDNMSEVARHVGVRPETMSRYEAGKLEPSIHVVGALARLYAVSTDWLIYGAQGAPEGYHRWAESPRGQAASEAARAWAASINVPDGVPADEAFFDAVAAAYEHQLSRAEAAAAAAETMTRRSGE